MARILIIDDDPRITEMVEMTLRADGHDTRSFSDAESALVAAGTMRPDIMIVDISLPGRDGLAFVSAVRANSHVPIIFLTGRSQLRDKIRGYRVGGDDYIVKPFLTTELALRVDALLRRETWSIRPSTSASVGDLVLSIADGTARRGSRVVSLTAEQFDLALALASTPGQAWSLESLARRMGVPTTFHREMSETLYMKISRLRKRIDHPGEVRLLHTRRGVGYILSAIPP